MDLHPGSAIFTASAFVELPCLIAERQVGESKMSGSIVREALLRVTRWGVEYRVAEAQNLFHKLLAKRSAG